MSRLVEVSPQNVESIASNIENDIIPGLSRGEYGFIIGPPGAGKGYLSLSIAYELATGSPYLNLSNDSFIKPLRVLYWPIEDGIKTVSKRMLAHYNLLSDSEISLLKQNFKLWDSFDAISCKNSFINTPTFLAIQQSLMELILTAKDFDIVIIDTLREAAGNCHEVENDQEVKLALQRLAREANVALLVTHHPTKDVVRGKDAITSISGSGFSLTQANSRYALFLNKEVNKKKADRYLLSHSKHNNVEQQYVFNDEELRWTEDNLLIRQSITQSTGSLGVSDTIEISLEESIEVDSEFIDEIEPKTITIDDSILTESTKSKAAQHKLDNTTISKEMVDEYSLFLKNKKK